jgi:hypothetical protein
LIIDHRLSIMVGSGKPAVKTPAVKTPAVKTPAVKPAVKEGPP